MPVATGRISGLLESCPQLHLLLPLLGGQEAYLVGGAIRDLVTGRPLTDIDLIFPSDPTPLAKAFARRIDGHWFWLDQERLQSRVVRGTPGASPGYDFALFRAASLEEDLLDRDFTINALALPLRMEGTAGDLIDPCRGLADLQQGLLRMVGGKSLVNDPLRIIKGVRHATALDLSIEPATLRAMRAAAAGLSGVAVERVRQEFWKLLTDRQVGRGLQMLVECQAGDQLFGSGFAVAWPEAIDSLADSRARWRQLRQKFPVIEEWLAEEVEQQLSTATLLLFTRLLAVVGRELPGRLALEWKLSRKARAVVAAVSTLGEGIWGAFLALAPTGRAFAWWAARHQCHPRALFLALAGMPGPADSHAILVDWLPRIADLADKRPRDLVDGHWLRRELGLAAGPQMSRALELLRNAEMCGTVSSRDEARRFLARKFHNRD